MRTPSPRLLGTACIALLGASTLLLLHVARHGPSSAVPPIFPASGHPLSPGIAYLLTALAALAGAGSTACGLFAIRRGWSIRPHTLAMVGVVAAAFLASSPPVGTADIGSYAAYGHMEARGIDSYATTPAKQTDATSALSEDPWRDTANVYGPVGTWVFEQADRIGATPRETVRWLQRGAWLAFALTGLMLLCAANDRQAKLRAALLWSANPLLALHLVAGAHLDVLVALLVVASVLSARQPLARGFAAGLAVAVKATAGWAALGLVLGRPRTGRLRRVFVTSLVVVIAYAFSSAHVFDQSRHASRYVSAGTPWRWVASALELVFSHSAARALVALAAIATAIGLALLLTVAFSHWPVSGTPARAARSALIPALAWTLVAPYQLPWYDATVWALLAVSVAMTLDWVLLAHTFVLTVAYLPGRVVALGDVPHGLQVAARSGVAPVVVLLCAATAPWMLSRRLEAR